MNWFWSLTLYDAETTAMYPNPIERYSIGDRTDGLQTNDDGSLTVTIQHGEPVDPKARANWLPAPEGGFYLCCVSMAPSRRLLLESGRPRR